MCYSIDKSDWKITSRFLAESFSVIMSGSILTLQFGLFKKFWVKRRYSVLFG